MSTITPKDLAVECNTDPRTIRKFLRSPEGLDAKVGKGHRWSIESRQVKALKGRFEKWHEARQNSNDEITTPDDDQ